MTSFDRMRRLWRGDLLGLATLCAIAAIPRLVGLGAHPLWMDEAYTHWFASRPLAYLWGTVPRFETHPPVYYTLIKLVELGSDHPFWLRMPSVLFSLALLPVTFAAGRAVIPTHDARARPGQLSCWMAVVWLALSGSQIAYAQEARPYSALCLAIAVLLWGGLRAIGRWPALLEREAGWRAFAPELAGLGLGTGLTLWLHNVGPVYVVALTAPLYLWALCRPQRLRCLVLLSAAMACAALIYAPYVPFLLHRAGAWSQGSWMAPLTPYRAIVVLEELFSLHGLSQAEGPPRLLLLAVLALAALGLLACWRRVGPWQAVLLAGAVGLPLLMLGLASVALAPVFAARTLLPVSVPIALLVGMAVDVPRAGAARWLAGSAVVGVLLLSAGWGYDSRQDEPWDTIALILRGQVGPRDALLLFPNDVAVPLGYYLGEDLAGLPVIALPGRFPALGLDDPYPYGTASVPGLTAADIAAMDAATRQAATVWLLSREGDNSPYVRMVRASLDARRTLLEERPLYGGYLVLLHWGAARGAGG